VRDMKKCKKYRRFFVTFAKTKIQGILQWCNIFKGTRITYQ
jgi:hypothetical protein